MLKIESMLWNHFSKLKSKREQITKIATERPTIKLRSQVDQLNASAQNKIIRNEKPEKILGKDSWKTTQMCYEEN